MSSDNKKRPRSTTRNGEDGDSCSKSAYEMAYENVRFHPLQSTARPATPHRYFAESYEVEHLTSIDGGGSESDQRKDAGNDSKSVVHRRQVVHKHANGLVIVTAGHAVSDSVMSSASSDNQQMSKGMTLVRNLGGALGRLCSKKDISSLKPNITTKEPSLICC